MIKDIHKKIVIIAIVLLFFGTTIVPTINASSSSDSEYDLLIISPKIFSRSLKPLVDHKNDIGVDTNLITLDEVYTQMASQGRDDAEKIKYFIKYAIEEWNISYVLLVGGMKRQTSKWYLPVRYVQMDDNWESQYISDLYYADIYDSGGNFSSWDTDDDGIFGEWYFGKKSEDTNIDLYPDIAVGRLPCRNILEARTMVNKIIEYETNTYNKDWFNNFVVIAGDTYPECNNPNWTCYEGEYYGNLAIENMTGFNPIRLYTSDETFTGEADVIDAINDGCGFLYFEGHGNPQSWGTHPPNNNTFINGLTTKSMHKLKNKNMYPVCIVGGCHNCQFDVNIRNLFRGILEDGLHFFSMNSPIGRFWYKEWIPECWGWRMTHKVDGGSIATIGCTGLGYTKEDKESFVGGSDELEVEFFKQYRQNNVDIVGDTWAKAIGWYINTYPIDWNTSKENGVSDSWIDTKIVQSWVLFGDPSLKIGGYQ